MTLLNDIWNLIKDFQWPIIILLAIALIVFRRDFPSLFHRAKVIQLPGGFKFEFYEDLRRLQDSADKAAAEVVASESSPALAGELLAETHPQATLPTQPAESLGQASGEKIERISTGSEMRRSGSPVSEVVESILSEAASNPRTALTRLSVAIEDEIARLLASAGFLAGQTFMPLSQAARVMRSQYRVLPDSVLSALEAFQIVRNQIAHNREIDSDDIVRAIDSGLTILRTLQGMPRTRYVVVYHSVPIYSDKEGKTELRGVKGVVIEQISQGGIIKTRHVHPTTRMHFTQGMEVAWEWNDHAQWGESWYRDPSTGEIKYGWTESLEFVGRDLDNLVVRQVAPPGID